MRHGLHRDRAKTLPCHEYRNYWQSNHSCAATLSVENSLMSSDLPLPIAEGPAFRYNPSFFAGACDDWQNTRRQSFIG